VFLLVLAVRVGSEDVNNFAWHSPDIIIKINLKKKIVFGI